MSDLKVHLAVPWKITPAGYYVDTACGWYASGIPRYRTDDRALVTCRACQRTHAWKIAPEETS